MITLSADTVPVVPGLWSSGQATNTGGLTWSLLTAAAGSDNICYLPVAAAPGQRWFLRLWAAAPTGPSYPLQALLSARDAGGVALANYNAGTITTSPTQQALIVETGSLPAGTVSLRLWVGLSGASAAAGRTLNLSFGVLGQRATADQLLTGRLDQPTGVTALDTPAGPVLARTPAGALRGTLQYLHPDLASATAMRRAYLSGPVTLTDPGNPLDGLRHTALGKLQLSTERAVPGVPARWTLTADIIEA